MKENVMFSINITKSWDHIYSNLIRDHRENLSKAGLDFEQFAKHYFLCEPSVCNEYKQVWLFKEVPLKIKDKLGLGQRDYGIDLVLEDQEGRLSVVQCKFKKDQDSSLSWSKDKLANMLADGDKADFFIIFTNASGIDAHTHSKKPNKLKVITLGDLIQLSSDTLEAMLHSMLKKEFKPVSKKSPRDYQETAIKETIDGFKNNDRGQLILPCGTGKTLISLWIHERMNPNYALVLFPSLALLRQTKNEWTSNRQQYVPHICVCSEKDIDKDDKGDSPHLALYELSGNVSTDPDEIRAYLQQNPKAIVFSTYQSLRVVAEAIKETGIEFDLALCDEAHKTAGSRKGMYGFVHDDTNIRIKKRLYMTATPRILGDNAKNKLNDEELTYVADMSDIKTFGTEFHHMNFKDAIEQGILVDYEIIAMGVSDSEIAALIKERQYISDDVTADELANNYALEKFMKDHQSVHAITFHSSVKKAQGFQERHQDLFTDIEAFHVNGKQTTNERSVTLNAFANSPKSVVTNARCLTEGVDVPAIDAVYFCDPKNSKIDIVQAAGRALRRADHLGKQLGYIVVPIFHRNRDNLKEAIEEGVFNNLVSVVRAISAHDERLVDEIRKIKLGNGEHPTKSKHLAFEGAINLIQLVDMVDLTESLFDQMITKIKLSWRSFEEARAFVRSLRLKNKTEWEAYCKSGGKPYDIPTNPNVIYKGKGWIRFGDWLGTGYIANQKRVYLSYEKARAFVHGLKLKNGEEWQEFCNKGDKPSDIPNKPDLVYKGKGWISWGDWLGSGVIANKLKKYRPFQDARAFVHGRSLKSGEEWKEYCKSGKKPKDIPASPQNVYKLNGWKDWGDWLGTGFVAYKNRNYLPFEAARAYAQCLKLKNNMEWRAYSKSGKRPKDIPATPDSAYKKRGWISWGDWLGTGYKTGDWKPFDEARKFARGLKLKNHKDWSKYCKSGEKPEDIPANPRSVYNGRGWFDWGDWLGTQRTANQKREFLSFEKARAFVHSLGLKSRTVWEKYCKEENMPKNIPTNPQAKYKNNGWNGWSDWLGNGRTSNYGKNK